MVQQTYQTEHFKSIIDFINDFYFGDFGQKAVQYRRILDNVSVRGKHIVTLKFH